MSVGRAPGLYETMPFTFANALPTESTSGLLVPGLTRLAASQSSDGPVA